MKIIHILRSSKLYLLLPLTLLAFPTLSAQLSGLSLSTPIMQKHHQGGFKSIIIKYLSPRNKSDYYDDVSLFIGEQKITELSFNQQVIIPLSKSIDISKMKLEAKYETETGRCQLKNQNTSLITCNIQAIKIPVQEVMLLL